MVAGGGLKYLDTLKVAIRQAVGEMPLEMALRALDSSPRMDAMCIQQEGWTFKDASVIWQNSTGANREVTCSVRSGSLVLSRASRRGRARPCALRGCGLLVV